VVAEVGRCNGECINEMTSIFDEERGTVKVGEEPFVHIHVKRVGK